MVASKSVHHHQLVHGSKRRPLQPKNQTPNVITISNLVGVKLNHVDISSSNKENFPPIQSANESFPMDSSLGDELNAIREKMDRLRIDRDMTDKLLREKRLVMDLQLKEILNRGENQKQLEIEVDRLYRLNQIRLACTRISQIRSLRDKEQEKKMKLNKTYAVTDERKES